MRQRITLLVAAVVIPWGIPWGAMMPALAEQPPLQEMQPGIWMQQQGPQGPGPQAQQARPSGAQTQGAQTWGGQVPAWQPPSAQSAGSQPSSLVPPSWQPSYGPRPEVLTLPPGSAPPPIATQGSAGSTSDSQWSGSGDGSVLSGQAQGPDGQRGNGQRGDGQWGGSGGGSVLSGQAQGPDGQPPGGQTLEDQAPDAQSGQVAVDPTAPAESQPIEPAPPPWPNQWVPARSARILALDKVNAQAATLVVPIGRPTSFGSLTITVRACNVRPPDQPSDATAFLTVTDSHRDEPGFDGWMLANEPSLSMMQNPIYDLRVTGCS